jgi:hypothetical protein
MNTAYMERHRDRWMFKPMWAQADDVGGKFLRALQASAAFSQVDEVKSLGFLGTDSDNRDLLIDAEFSGKYTQDPAGFGKAFMTGFLLLLPAPFIRYEDAYFASAELNVYDRSGRLLHKYSERQDVSSSAALFSAGSPGSVSAGIDSAAANLAAKLVTAILADREGYERALKQAPPPPSRKPEATSPPLPETAAVAASAAEPAPADSIERVKSSAGAAHAELDAEAAGSEPAPSSQASAKPQPARRGPLTSAEEAEIDEQVMP